MVFPIISMSKKDRIITEDLAYLKMARVCAKKEYSPFDISRKLSRMGFDYDTAERVIVRLKNENFLNEERYTRSYVNDKLRFNGWGVKKIEMSLRQKQLPQEVIDKILDHYSGSELNQSLKPLLEKKWKRIKGDSEYEKKGKLIRYAVGRGFKMSDILECMKNMNLRITDDE